MATIIEVNAADCGPGLVPNDPAAAANNAAAIAAAFRACPRVFLPDGQTYYTQQISPPANARSLRGAATLLLGGARPGTGSALLSIGGTTGFVCRDFTVRGDPSGIGGVILGNAVGTEFHGVTASGSYGFGSISSGQGPIDTLLDHCSVPLYALNAFSFPSVTKMSLRDCYGSGGQNRSQATFLLGGTDLWVSRGQAFQSKGFGLGIADANRFTVAGFESIDSALEGIQVTNGMTGTVTGCRVLFPSNPPFSTDFGMSFAAEKGGQSAVIDVTGCVVDASAKAAVGIAGEGGDGAAQRINIAGNTFTSPNFWGASVDFPGHTPAVVIYGVNANDNAVSGNLIRDLAGHCVHKVIEWDAGDGAPNGNYLGQNPGFNPGIRVDNVRLGAQSKLYQS